jgi:5-methylcytosine-specific restriction protein A
MRLQTLRPRLPTVGTRLNQLARVQVDRLRGKAAVERRRDWLYDHPLCTECTKAGAVTAATVPDHIVPLWAGGPDDLNANGRSLCAEHHDAKTRCEARMRAAGGWLSTACTCGQHLDVTQPPIAAPAPA